MSTQPTLSDAAISSAPRATSRIEISRTAYRKNLSFLKSVVGDDCALASVVKGNAYGHGIEGMVPLAEEWGIRHFCVFSAEEARVVHATCRDPALILVLGYLAPEEIEWAVEHGVSFACFDVDRVREARVAAERTSRRARLHLDLETGMNRTGLEADAFEEALALVAASPELLTLEGLCTHYAGAESEGNHVRIQHQISSFRRSLSDLKARKIEPRLRHTSGSAATFAYPEARMDMVRVGISQYGYWPSQETRLRFLLEPNVTEGRVSPDPLCRILRWTTRVMSIKTVAPGEFVGYGRSYLTTREQRIATIPVGYAQGFPRGLSNLGYVLVRGQRAPVVGVVNMNLTTIDVTEASGVEVGDEVVLIGRQGRNEISVGWFGDMTRSLNYEVLVRIPREVPRVIVK
jgi:alanine racemase